MHRNVKDMDRLCKIRDIQRAVNQFEQGFEKTYGICLNEGMALCSLLKAGSLSSGEIGELLGLTSSNNSKVIGSVEKKGLVERVISSLKCEQIEIAPPLLELLERSGTAE